MHIAYRGHFTEKVKDDVSQLYINKLVHMYPTYACFLVDLI